MGAACEEGGGERSPSWYVTREEFERGSPSRRDGVGAAKEAELRATYHSFIRDVCVRLQLPHITMATATVLCHRFYLRHSHARNEWQKNPDAAKRIHQEEVLAKQKALILVGETLLLSTIRFDFNIQHPYEPLKLALKNLGISQKEVRQASMNLINDALSTALVVQFKPPFIAAGSLFWAAKKENVVLPSQNDNVWWHHFDVEPKQLNAVMQPMNELCKKRYPDPSQTLMDKQQIKPTPTPTLMDKKQIKLTPALMDKQQIKPIPTLMDTTPTPTLMDKKQIKPTPALMDKQQIKPTPTLMDKQKIKPTPTPALLDKQQIKLTSTLMDKQQIKPTSTPTLMDRQQIISNQDHAHRHTHSSRRSFSNNNTEASRCVPVGSFDKKSTSRSARNEENLYWRSNEENQRQRTDEENQIISNPDPAQRHTQSSRRSFGNSSTEASRCMPVGSFDKKSANRSARTEEDRYWRTDEENRCQQTDEENRCRRTDEENQYRWRHINHNLDIVSADQRLEGALKADRRGYHIRSGSKDMNATIIMDLSRQKRIREVGVYISDTNDWTIRSWKKQKFERR